MFTLLLAASGATAAVPSVAFFYGAQAPLDELHAFDIAVVDPDHGADPLAYRTQHSELYAYVSVGEANPSRPWFKDIPADWRLTTNRTWGSDVIDLSQPGWTSFLVDRVVAPLWARGYRGFFLDTLDSYRLATKFDEPAQQNGLVAIVETLRRRFPDIRLILNRGFDIVPRVKDEIAMVAAESLFRGWNANAQRYVDVKPGDRDWVLGQLRKIRDESGVPVLAIDYVDPADRVGTRATAEKIRALGIVPWVSDGKLESLGVGTVEVMPRKVLIVYDSKEAAAVNYSNAHRYLEMPLNHLGYTAVYVDVNEALPSLPLSGRYAGIVTWFSGYVGPSGRLADWLQHAIDHGMRVAVVGSFGLGIEGRVAKTLGLATLVAPVGGKLEISQQHPMIGFETKPLPDRAMLEPVQLAADSGGQSLLQLSDNSGKRFDAAALTRWGGYVLDPFTVVFVPGSDQVRWVVDPFAFLQKALALPEMPVPDVTTENGRRLMFAHIDGDGFPSRAESPGSPFAAQVLFDNILTEYRVPTTMSVIESELAPDGLYPKLSEQLEGIARRIFRLPLVEVASHTYSHPFRWDKVKHGIFQDENVDGEYYHLQIPGYKLDLRREIFGSIDYVQRRLAPPGKPVRMLLWSGDTAPGADALSLIGEGGWLNLNGGNTMITRSRPSLGLVTALGIEKGGVLQVYAPIGNENLYTNLWRGPFYGYRNVIETFAMTESPRRLKPIDLYYHVYSASKRASLSALREAYQWAMAQPTQPIFASEYVRKVQDFYTMIVARSADGWLLRSRGELRTLRAPRSLGVADLAQSTGVVGFNRSADGTYLHLSGDEARLRFTDSAPQLAYLANANARLDAAELSETGLKLKLRGHVPIEFALANAQACSVTAEGRPIIGRKAADLFQYKLNDAAATIEAICR